MFNPPSNANKKSAASIDPIHTLLGKGTFFQGDVHLGLNSLRIEGTVEGTLTGEGEITVAPGGLVKGTVHAKHLIVSGRIEGVVKVQQCLEIHGTGWVEGEIETGVLVVDEGGTLLGHCVRRSSPEPPAPASTDATA
ncbi:MAG: polymer-forming cytoskeletal protein [Firmicutes bacterium]|nr:polymer-forming cytoskeletal protein [Bacillota bacterium]